MNAWLFRLKEYIRPIWWLTLISLAVSLPTTAQMSTGTILGVVKDTSGASVPGATITIRSVETNKVRLVTTGADGAFRVAGLPVGHYSLSIEKAGFETETRQDLTLDVAQDLVANATLTVGSSSQQVVVTGEAPQVNTTTSSLGHLVSENQVADLPLNGRSFVDLSLMQTGVTKNVSFTNTAGNAGTWFNSNGAPSESNNYMLDGAIMGMLVGETNSTMAGTSLGVDGIREFKVETNSFSAEYGLRMGSQMLIVTKSGTNQFHGDVFEYLRNNALDGP